MKLDLPSDRLILTPLESSDVDLAVDLWTDPEVVRHICDVPTEEEIRQEMPDTIKRGGYGCIGIWCIADRRTGDKLGYFLKPSAWGQGYATEVCKRILQFAFQEASLNELVASVDENNVASKNVLEKSGFRYLYRTRCWGKESPIYKISRVEWIELQQSI
jgi:RimJ/RimL family protein N-acetyltransferase